MEKAPLRPFVIGTALAYCVARIALAGGETSDICPTNEVPVIETTTDGAILDCVEVVETP